MKSRFDLDLDNAWTPEGNRSLRRSLPADLRTPEAAWAYGLSVPIEIAEAATPLYSARLALDIGDVHGQVRVGVVSQDGTRFIASRLVDRHASGKVVLPLQAIDPAIGPLVVQNMSQAGASHFTIRAIEWVHYPAAREANLHRYMREGFNTTEGWCHYLNIAFLRAFDELLFGYGIDGGVCEIGIHHGKQFIALHNLLPEGASSVAIDVFGDQEFNLDGSGFGDYARFKANLEQWAVTPESCLILRRDSLSLRDAEIDALVKQTGPVKFFGVDGCHEVEHTIADLRTAMRMTAQGGIIVLDDYLNPDFPGVHQAVAYLFLTGRPGIAPFAIGQNKLYLTQVSHHDRYLQDTRKVVKKIPETDTLRDVNLYGYRALSWRTADAGWAFPETT